MVSRPRRYFPLYFLKVKDTAPGKNPLRRYFGRAGSVADAPPLRKYVLPGGESHLKDFLFVIPLQGFTGTEVKMLSDAAEAPGRGNYGFCLLGLGKT